MNLKRLLGFDEEIPDDEGEGPVVIRVEVNGKTYVRRYPDLDMAHLRFPQYLADLAVLLRGDS